ncbi:MAG: hypothetical protein AAGB01_10930 [Cyanobacteria bacterium P01_F01_bin.42]
MMRTFVNYLPGLAIAILVGQPGFANPTLEGGQEIEATVSSVTNSAVTLQTPGGTETYKYHPDALAKLGLASGDSVVLDTTRFETGTITGLDAYTVKVRLDNDEKRSFILDREGRRFLTYGDRIVIRPSKFPSRCQRLYNLEDYELQGGDIRKVVVFEPAPVPPPAPTPVPPPPAPVAPPPAPLPVPGLG